MNLRGIARLVLRTVAGVLAAAVSLYAIYSAIAVDFRFNPVLTFLYCLLPGLSFLVFLFVRRARREAVLQAALFIGYWVCASMLSWRTCSAYGYCISTVDTALGVLKARPALAFLAVVLLSLISIRLDGKRRAEA